MPERLSPEDRSKTMRAVKGSGTSLERRLWSMLAGMRLSGWRRNASSIPGRPDAAFIEGRVAVFVDGCFWHGCPNCARPMPEANADYWITKINRNIERDGEINKKLSEDGWTVVRIWEHEMRDFDSRKRTAPRIKEALEKKPLPT